MHAAETCVTGSWRMWIMYSDTLQQLHVTICTAPVKTKYYKLLNKTGSISLHKYIK